MSQVYLHSLAKIVRLLLQVCLVNLFIKCLTLWKLIICAVSKLNVCAFQHTDLLLLKEVVVITAKFPAIAFVVSRLVAIGKELQYWHKD